MSTEFSQLKQKLKEHLLKCKTHSLAVDNMKEREISLKKVEERKVTVGMNLGRVIYKNIKNNESDNSFEDDIFVQVQNKVDVGDINHCKNLVSDILPHIADDVRQNLIQWFKTRLEQTGFLPVGKLITDGATIEHRQREFIGFYTCVPDSTDLIRTIYIGFSLVKNSTGRVQTDGVIDALKLGTDNCILKSEQYLGTSVDGFCIHCSVPKLLDEFFEVPKDSRHHDYDPMHKAGRQDIHIREDEKFSWFVELTKTIGDAFKLVNIGNQYEHFLEWQNMMIESKDCPQERVFQPIFYNKSRYANSTRHVYRNALETYPAMVKTLEDTINRCLSKKPHKYQPGKSEEVDATLKVAEKASRIANEINNVRFATKLAGINDIYEVYGHATAIIQTVNLLPHERKDAYFKIVAGLETMIKCVSDHSLCPLDSQTGEVSCMWPNLHKEIEDLKNGMFRKQVLAAKYPEQTKTRKGCAKQQEAKQKDQLIEGLSEVTELCTVLHSKLSENVFNRQTREFIESLRPITDLQSLATRVLQDGSTQVWEETSEAFVEIAHDITPQGETLSIPVLKEEYKQFLVKLREENSKLPEVMNSKDNIKIFINSEKKLYKGITNVIHVIWCAAVSTGIESIIESHISIFKHRVKSRHIGDERADNEMMIKINGPALSEMDGCIMRAMDKSGKNWHFVRGERTRKEFKVSKVVDKKQAERSPLPFAV